jgi:16S rRNA (guanine1207-N2)-methyltransferase
MPRFRAKIDELDLAFDTDPRLFSPRAVDPGTAAMLGRVHVEPHDKVLDLGCGYGVVGVYAAHRTDPQRVWLVDIDPLAVDFARRNLELNGVEGAATLVSDGFGDLEETGFTKIFCNPPYHVDFSVPKRLIEKGFNRLALGGSMIFVVKRETWYRNKLHAIFSNVQNHRSDDYVILESTKTSSQYAVGRR